MHLNVVAGSLVLLGIGHGISIVGGRNGLGIFFAKHVINILGDETLLKKQNGLEKLWN